VRETIRCPAPLFSAPRRCSFKPDDRGSFKPDDRALACVERTHALNDQCAIIQPPASRNSAPPSYGGSP
jgi:hypothetical protein